MESRQNKKIPTLIGLIIILIGLGISVFFIKRSQNIFLKAKAENNPNQLKISNISSNSFVVSWVTAKPTIGWIKIGKAPNSFDQQWPDERNTESEKEEAYLVHYINITGLDPAVTYYFEVYCDSQKYDDNGIPYQTTTAPEIKQAELANDLAYGIILDINGQPAEEAIVYLNMANSSLQSSLVSSSGNWAIPLNLARSEDLSSFVSYDSEASAIEIFVQGKDLTASAVTTTSNNSPVPPITLGESLDFRQKTVAKSAEEDSLSDSGFSLEDLPVSTPSYSLIILNPKPGEAVSTQKPEFLGKGPAGEEITIQVESPLFTGKTIPNEWGDWNWSITNNLEPGEHKITLNYIDDQGKKHEISHQFIVLAADESDLPAFTATPSASPTSQPALTPTPAAVEPTVTISPTGMPTPSISPTATPPAPTTKPTGALSPSPTTTPSAMEIKPGVLTPTLVSLIMGLILVACGSFIEIVKK
ncbi:MAG TPA: fibronectin type III domain-containing protein [Candidatus Bathyarchaeia archaeon]|nr:fibronectin type III domain-containing protein [Candidatus Bathyarchaeia archaeon]